MKSKWDKKNVLGIIICTLGQINEPIIKIQPKIYQKMQPKLFGFCCDLKYSLTYKKN